MCRPLNRTSKWNSLDIYFRPGLILEAPINVILIKLWPKIVFKVGLVALQLEVITYKKFRTVYRPNLIKFKTELCAQLNHTDHPFLRTLLNLKYAGNMNDLCPLRVRLEISWTTRFNKHYQHTWSFDNSHRIIGISRHTFRNTTFSHWYRWGNGKWSLF